MFFHWKFLFAVMELPLTLPCMVVHCICNMWVLESHSQFSSKPEIQLASLWLWALPFKTPSFYKIQTIMMLGSEQPSTSIFSCLNYVYRIRNFLERAVDAVFKLGKLHPGWASNLNFLLIGEWGSPGYSPLLLTFSQLLFCFPQFL